MVSSLLAERLAPARELLTANDVPWAVAGGWALDLFLGHRTREHADLDLAIWRVDQHKLRAALIPDWVAEIADNGVLRPWNADEWLSLPIHEIHARSVSGTQPRLELLLNERDDTAWIYRRDTQVRRELDRTVLVRDTIPCLSPEIVLLYKSKAPRPTDEADFRVALPALSAEQRAWLRLAITRLSADHPWVGELGRTGRIGQSRMVRDGG
jgi:aminoglycoside-2''-adenylyltransferase